MKFAIIKVNKDYEIKILAVFFEHKEGVEFLHDFISKTYKEENKDSFKVYYDSKDCVSVFYSGYTGKYLDSKYYIVTYEDFEN